MGLTAQKTAICHDRTVHDIPTRVWTIKDQGDWLWRVAEWLLGTFCDEESPVTLAQSPFLWKFGGLETKWSHEVTASHSERLDPDSMP